MPNPTPEQLARQQIDAQLLACGWLVQDYKQIDSVARVTICSIQPLYSMLRGEELDEDLDEKSGYEISTADDRPKDVAYNAAIPIETFDFIVTDECHQSIYGLWRQVLEYFDTFLIGLTATPSKQTIGFFNQNLVMEYSHERAAAADVNVGYDVYRIRTQATEQGGKVDKGFYMDGCGNRLTYTEDVGRIVSKDLQTINEHIPNVFEERELSPDSVIRKSRITADDGKNYDTARYNLEIITFHCLTPPGRIGVRSGIAQR